jgi:hypothetical protein
VKFNTIIRDLINEDMEEKNPVGWKKLLNGYPWFRCRGCYSIPAYSEFMPSPRLGRKPYGKTDNRILKDEDPYGWHISEMEEEYELKPGIEHIGHQIMSNIIKLGKGLPEHFISGHGDENLMNNPTGHQNCRIMQDCCHMRDSSLCCR